MDYTEEDYNFISQQIIKAAIEIHKEPGPGLYESVYELCLTKVLRDNGLEVENQVDVPIEFRGERFTKAFTIDLLVSNLVVIELKAVPAILPVHEAQLVTYLKLSRKRLGLLINFNEQLLKDGVRRRVNGSLNHSTLKRDSAAS